MAKRSTKGARDVPEEVIAEMYAPPSRRWFGVGVLYALGALLLALAVLRPPQALIWLVFLFAAGAFAIWAAEQMRMATLRGLRLTEEALWDTSGTQIVALENVKEVDRGVFAFKPSNGFLLRTHKPQPFRWHPGLYWVIGRRVGVGGATSRAQARMMADTITMVLAEQRAPRS